MAQNNPYALSFDGVNDYIGPITLPANPYCIEFWFYTASTLTKNSPQMVFLGFGFPFIFIGNASSGFENETITVATTGSAMTYITDNIPAGTHHLCINWNGTTYDFYVDGIKKITYLYGSGSGLLPKTPLYIGYRGNYGQYFAGPLDEIRIWSAPRTGQQIADNMAKRLTGNEAGLILYYRLDEGSGNTVHDSSASGISGAITGATWINGLVDLSLSSGGNVKEISATAYGAAAGSIKLLRGRFISATACGHASAMAHSIRGRGIQAVVYGAATATARFYKIANARAAAQGAAIAKMAVLVLTIPPGIYMINADEIFDRNQPITPDSLANYIEVYINPLQPVAEAIEVYKSTDPIPIDAGEIKTITVFFNKQPVIEGMAQLENAPIGAAISEAKYYAWGADITVTSPSAGAFDLIVTGKPLEVQGRELVVKKDETSILENGIKKYTFDNPFVQDRETAEMIAEKLLAFAVPQADIEIEWRGDPALQLADVVMIPEYQRQGLDQRGFFYVTKQELDFDGGLRAKLEGRKMYG